MTTPNARNVGSEDADAPTADEAETVEHERDRLKEFVRSLDVSEIKSGDWFAKLLTASLESYSKTVDWEYFQIKYEGVPADAIVDQRIKMAARYAMIEGGLSASAYTGAVAATIGSLGGASPITVSAGLTTMMVDLVYISQLQLRLAYDIAVLYRVPLDLQDPDDLWKLIRVAFTIKGGELAKEGMIRSVPGVLRPLIVRYYSGSTRAAAQALPVVGKHLLKRNIIKVGLPLVGVPLAAALNRWTTSLAGQHARTVFRSSARIMETAEKLVDRSEHPQLLLWIAWLVVDADKTVSDDEAFFMRHLVLQARERHGVIDEHLERVVHLDPDDVWARVDAVEGDLADIIVAAETVAEIDGAPSARQRRMLDELRKRCGQCPTDSTPASRESPS